MKDDRPQKKGRKAPEEEAYLPGYGDLKLRPNWQETNEHIKVARELLIAAGFGVLRNVEDLNPFLKALLGFPVQQEELVDRGLLGDVQPAFEYVGHLTIGTLEMYLEAFMIRPNEVGVRAKVAKLRRDNPGISMLDVIGEIRNDIVNRCQQVATEALQLDRARTRLCGNCTSGSARALTLSTNPTIDRMPTATRERVFLAQYQKYVRAKNDFNQASGEISGWAHDVFLCLFDYTRIERHEMRRRTGPKTKYRWPDSLYVLDPETGERLPSVVARRIGQAIACHHCKADAATKKCTDCGYSVCDHCSSS